MKPKEQGYVLSIDQASNAAGVTLWHNGNLASWVLLSSENERDPFPKRMAAMVEQLQQWLDIVLIDGQQIDTVLFEGVRLRLVTCTVGAFCSPTQLRNCHVKEKSSFIESSSWKSYARKQGATGAVKDIKGVKALSEIGFPLDQYPIKSDDIADSVLIYLTWASK